VFENIYLKLSTKLNGKKVYQDQLSFPQTITQFKCMQFTKYPVWAGPVYTSHIKYHMIDIMEKVSSQKETVNNEHVAQHVRALPKARL